MLHSCRTRICRENERHIPNTGYLGMELAKYFLYILDTCLLFILSYITVLVPLFQSNDMFLVYLYYLSCVIKNSSEIVTSVYDAN